MDIPTRPCHAQFLQGVWHVESPTTSSVIAAEDLLHACLYLSSATSNSIILCRRSSFSPRRRAATFSARLFFSSLLPVVRSHALQHASEREATLRDLRDLAANTPLTTFTIEEGGCDGDTELSRARAGARSRGGRDVWSFGQA